MKTLCSLVSEKEKSVEHLETTKKLGGKQISHAIIEEDLAKYRVVVENEFYGIVRKYVRTRLISLLQK
jgi:hypothetical protein